MFSVWRRIHFGPRLRLASGDTSTSANPAPPVDAPFLYLYLQLVTSLFSPVAAYSTGQSSDPRSARNRVIKKSGKQPNNHSDIAHKWMRHNGNRTDCAPNNLSRPVKVITCKPHLTRRHGQSLSSPSATNWCKHICNRTC